MLHHACRPARLACRKGRATGGTAACPRVRIILTKCRFTNTNAKSAITSSSCSCVSRPCLPAPHAVAQRSKNSCLCSPWVPNRPKSRRAVRRRARAAAAAIRAGRVRARLTRHPDGPGFSPVSQLLVCQDRPCSREPRDAAYAWWVEERGKTTSWLARWSGHSMLAGLRLRLASHASCRLHSL